MTDILEKKISEIKQEFVKTYDGSSNIQEVIPAASSNLFPIDKNHLELLHLFIQKNPIYYNSYKKTITDIPCVVYEGDINKYWLNSIQHTTSRSPFSPTWILSAYLVSLRAKMQRYTETLDIGSGDGRIAYCSQIQEMASYSIEIDNELVNLQANIADATGIKFNSYCSDAGSFDYISLKLTKPIFFIGGLAKMGGDALAKAVIKKIGTSSKFKKNVGIVFVGTFSQKYSLESTRLGGWGKLIEKHNLKIIDTITLPTAWTLRENRDTPYIFAEFSRK